MKPKPHVPDNIRHPLSDAIDMAIEEDHKQNNRPRGYLGMSAIGKACARSLWYGFRFASGKSTAFPARTLRHFADGHRTEDLAAERINNIPGCQLVIAREDGEQFACEAHSGHFSGHCDGFLKGVPGEDPEEVFLWENKCSSHKTYNNLKNLINKTNGDTSHVMYQWNPTYYFQVQIYMERFNKQGMNIKRSIHTVDCAGGREETLVIITPLDQMHSEGMLSKAKMIIDADHPDVFPRVATTPTAYDCTFCDHKQVCHNGEDTKMSENCRTCRYVTPVVDSHYTEAPWYCSRHEKFLSFEEQMSGCMSYEVIDMPAQQEAAA